MTSLAVYDGRALCGSIREDASGKAEAFDAVGQSLGCFPSRKAALAAIPRAAEPYAKHTAGLGSPREGTKPTRGVGLVNSAGAAR